MVEEKRNIYILMASFVVTEMLALIFANNILVSQIPIEQYQPFGNENIVQATANSGILILFVIAFTLFLILILKLKFHKFFKLIAIGMPIFFLFVFLTQQDVIVAQQIFKLSDAVANIVFFGIIAYTAALVYSIWKGITKVVVTGFILTSSLIGAYLAVSISPPTLFILPIAFALYDIYAVFKGPLKALIKVAPLSPSVKGKGKGRRITESAIAANLHKQFGLMLARIGGFTIGAGDFTFYSMLVAAAFVVKGLVAAFAVGVAINVGVVVTLWILQKYKRPLPGLPIPITLGIVTMILV